MTESSNNEEQEPQSQERPSQGRGISAVSKHMLENKIDTALWATRILTLLFSISYYLPFFQ